MNEYIPKKEESKMESLISIKESALKWWAIMKRNGEDKGGNNCSLCTCYNASAIDDCKYCPVQIFTGKSKCNSTPYDDWYRHASKHEMPRIVSCPECYDIAREEFLFLCKLYRNHVNE